MALSHVSESLQEQIALTGGLLHRVHQGCTGINKNYQPETSKLFSTYPDIERKLFKSFPEHPGTIDLVKVDRLGADELWRHCDEIVREVEPDYNLLREINAQSLQNIHLLTNIANNMAPFSLDYTATMLHQYMQLFCNTGRLFLLLRFYPSKVIVQLYTLVHSHVRLQDKNGRRQELADRQEIVELVASFDRPVPKLQQAFQAITPRISQVLELVVAPVLLAFATARDAQDSQMLNALRLPEADAQCQQMLELSAPAAIRGLQLLPKLQDWAMLGLLISPGACNIPKVAKMMRQLLETNFRMQIYREYGDWLHVLYAAHVQPTLSSHYKNVKGSVGHANRKTLKEESKDAIDNAFSVARATCMQEHCARRNLAQQSLEQFMVLMKADMNQLPFNLQNIMAALVYGKCEVLWYFKNVNEVIPTGVLQTLQTQPLKESSTDPSVSGLISAIHAMHDLLLQYRTAIQAFIIDTIHTLVEERISPVLVRLATTGPQAHSRPMVVAVQNMASVIEHFEALQLPHVEQVSNAEANLGLARALWNSQIGGLFSAGAEVSAAQLDEASGHSGVLHFMNQCMQLSEYMDGFNRMIQGATSLAELYDFPEKLVASMRSTVQGPVEGALFCSAWLYVLSCFQHAEKDSVHEEPCSMAIRLGEDYMKGVADKVKTLLLRISEAHNSELAGPLTVSASYARSQNAMPSVQPSTTMSKTSKVATFTSATLSKATTLKNRVLAAPTSSAPAYQPGQESLPANRGSLAPLEDSQTALTNLGQSLAEAPAIQLAPTYVMVPGEFLRAAVQDAFQYQITQLAFADKEIQRPTVLAGEVKCLISLIHRIAPLMTLHASVLVREALLRCTCTDKQPVSQQTSQQDAQLPSRPGSQQSNWSDRQQTGRQDGTQKVQQPTAPPVPVISSIAEWYMSMVVKDHRNIGVSISKARLAAWPDQHIWTCNDLSLQQRQDILAPEHTATGRLQASKSFVSLEKPLDIALYASYEELRAFCQIWGLYGVKEMAFRSRGVLTEAVSILDTTLRMHEPLLQRLKAEYLDNQSCHEACRTASSSLRDMPQALDALRIAARCLYLRQLLSDAAKRELTAQAPAVSGFLSGVKQAGAEFPGPEVADLVDLPRCSGSTGGGLASLDSSVDPVLAQLIQGNGDQQCVQRWQLWPLLLGLMHWSPDCTKATYLGSQEALSHNMSCISICSAALVAAVPTPDVTDENGAMSGADAMRCFVKCSSTALQLSAASGPSSGRMMMMDETAADLNDRSLLEDSHYAFTTIRSAYHQAFATTVKQGTTAY